MFNRLSISVIEGTLVGAFLGTKGGKSFVDRCTAYVGENAVECVKTSAFFNLPKDALIHLVSSDYVSSLGSYF